jgi:hypothetical protein
VTRVSRREFLKFIAAGAVVTIAGVAGLSSSPNKSRSRMAVAQAAGSWTAGPDTPSHPVHVALLHTGKVLYVAGSGYHRPSASGPFKAGIWDTINPPVERTVDADLFCCGHVLLPNGNILLAGGTLKYQFQTPNSRWWGLDAAYEFDAKTESFLQLPSMAHGRWYPTLVELHNGDIQVVAGYDEFGYHNLLTEIYDPKSKTWTKSFDPNSSRTYCVGCDSTGCADLQGAGAPCYGGSNKGVNPGIGLYPRMHLMPSGLVALVGQTGARRVWDPQTRRWHSSGTGIQRSYGTSVLLPLQNSDEENGKILVVGGAPKTGFPAVATNSAEILEPCGFSINSRSVQPMTYPRRYCNPVILPTGKIVIFGGTQENNDRTLAVYHPEMFDPVSESWSVLAPHKVPRIYHSGALLLKDGRVWTVGSSYSSTSYETRTEIFAPDYVSQTRPAISGSLAGAQYGGSIPIPTPNASSIDKVSLVKVSSTTHHYNTDQRLIWLQIQGVTSTAVTVRAPINARIAPPGYYMIHIINKSGVPSVGAMIRIGSEPVSIIYNVPSPGDSLTSLRAGGDTRVGEEALSGSALVGKSVKRWTVYLRKRYSPSGTISAVIRKRSGDAIAATFTETPSASSLPTTFSPFVFTLASAYVVQANDRFLVEYAGPSRVDVESWNIDKFDGGLTRKVKYGSGGYSGSFQNTKDTVGIMSST